MDVLQSYIFENAIDFKDIHYMKIMELLLKAHKSINIQQPVYRTEHVVDNLNEKVITFEKWFEIKDQLDWDNESSFIIKMQEITFLPHEEVSNVKIIFPECLTNLDRQKIHINASQNGFESFTSGKNTNIPRLHVILKTYHFLILNF